jgi:hypothetical protein
LLSTSEFLCEESVSFTGNAAPRGVRKTAK